MNETFARHVEALHPSYERLVAATPFTFGQLAQQVLPSRGVYLFSEGERHLYVGRSNDIRARIRLHCRPGSTDNQASFAFLLTREVCGVPKATYKPEGSRKQLLTQDAFAKCFVAQKERMRSMNIRAVEETDSSRQALLEMYVAISLSTPYNDFNNH
ncbi:hypothetical protein [Roseateles cavernae]|uniref:hypothetical protein n=1 Tax=Roseateles cavernae TaxID=3153578 RepID=UPI0032E440A3